MALRGSDRSPGGGEDNSWGNARVGMAERRGRGEKYPLLLIIAGYAIRANLRITRV